MYIQWQNREQPCQTVTLTGSSERLAGARAASCSEFWCSHTQAYILVLIWKPAQPRDPSFSSSEKYFSTKIAIPELLPYRRTHREERSCTSLSCQSATPRSHKFLGGCNSVLMKMNSQQLKDICPKAHQKAGSTHGHRPKAAERL